MTDDPSIVRVDIDSDLPGRIAVWSDYRFKHKVKAVPGARWSESLRRWHVPLTWPSCLALRGEIQANLRIEPDLRMWATGEKVTKEILTELRDELELEEPRVDLPGFESLFGYQHVGARLIKTAGQYLFCDETGTGKTRTALAGLALIHAELDPVTPVLVVAPKSMLITWARDEIPRFFPDADVRVCAGTPKKVQTALEPGADFYVISYDLLRRYSRHAAWGSVTLKEDQKLDHEIQALELKSIVADEVHRAKSPQAQQTRALWQAAAGTTYRIGLTGTPIQDTPADLWSLLHYVAPAEYPTKTAFEERYLLIDWNVWGGREVVGISPVREDEFRANFHARTRRVTKEQALPFLPPKVYETRWVELPPRNRRAYAQMVKDMIAEIAAGEVLTADGPLTRATRLIQLANSSIEMIETEDPVTGEVEVTYRMVAPSPKIEAFLEDVDAGDYDGQVVVFSESRQLIDILEVEMLKRKYECVKITGEVVGDDRQKAIDAFQAGEARFMLLTRAGGEGITLTAAATMVRLVRSWSYIVHAQAEDRIHRIGSEKHDSITYVDYITEDTIEVDQLARLNAKEARSEAVLSTDDLIEMIRH